MAQARLGENSDSDKGEQTVLSVKFETTVQGDLTEQGFPNRLSKDPFNGEHEELALPPSFRCSSNDIGSLIDHVYHTVQIPQPNHYFEERCILAPREGQVNQINGIMLKLFPGEMCHFGSMTGAYDPQNQLRKGTAYLMLKLGCPVILMRNGRRGIVTELGGVLLTIRMFSGQVVSVRRTELASMKGIILFQFPVKVAFAMTIEEAQGQLETFSTLGIDLRYPYPSRGQLLLALSTGINRAGIKCIEGTNMETEEDHREVTSHT